MTVTYHPWTDGYAVGFECRDKAGVTVCYVYLNPSTVEDSGDSPNVFLYYGNAGNPALDSAVIHVPLGLRCEMPECDGIQQPKSCYCAACDAATDEARAELGWKD